MKKILFLCLPVLLLAVLSNGMVVEGKAAQVSPTHTPPWISATWTWNREPVSPDMLVTAYLTPTITPTITPTPIPPTPICLQVTRRTGVRRWPSMWSASMYYLEINTRVLVEEFVNNQDPLDALFKIPARFGRIGTFAYFVAELRGTDYVKVIACP